MSAPAVTRAGKPKPKSAKPWRSRTLRQREIKRRRRKVWTMEQWNIYIIARDVRQCKPRVLRVTKFHRLRDTPERDAFLRQRAAAAKRAKRRL